MGWLGSKWAWPPSGLVSGLETGAHLGYLGKSCKPVYMGHTRAIYGLIWVYKDLEIFVAFIMHTFSLYMFFLRACFA